MGWLSKIAKAAKTAVKSVYKATVSVTKMGFHLTVATVTLNESQFNMALSNGEDAWQAVKQTISSVWVLAYAYIQIAVAVCAVVATVMGFWLYALLLLAILVALNWDSFYSWVKEAGQKVVDKVKEVLEQILEWVADVMPWWVWAILGVSLFGSLGFGKDKKQTVEVKNGSA